MFRFLKKNKTPEEENFEDTLSDEELGNLKNEEAKHLARLFESLGSIATVIDVDSTDEQIRDTLKEHAQKVAERERENQKLDGIKKEDLN